MSVTAAALILAWVVIAVLALALAAVVRVVRLQESRLQQLISEPRRLLPGDDLKLPPALRDAIGDHDVVLLLFVKSECRTCLKAISTVALWSAGQERTVPFVVLWQGRAQPIEPPAISLDQQQRVFDELRIGLMPFAVLLNGSTVVASGAVGSTSAVHELLDAAAAVAAKRLAGSQQRLNPRGLEAVHDRRQRRLGSSKMDKAVGARRRHSPAPVQPSER